MRWSLLILAALVAVGCGAPTSASSPFSAIAPTEDEAPTNGEPTSAAPLSPDLSLIRGYNWQAQAAEPFEAPYLVEYAAGPYQLTFVATAHRESPKSDTFHLIRRALATYEPSFIVLEGFPTDDGINPAWILEWAETCWGTDDCGEPAFAAHLAGTSDTPFVGGEPSDAEILGYVASRGYSAQDLVGFYAVRAISQWQRQGAVDPDPSGQIERYVADAAIDMGAPEAAMDYPTFCDWYADRRGRAFDPNREDPNDLAPILADDSTYIQTLSHWVGVARETHLVTVITDALNTHHDVMVIYGAGHLVKERDVLAHMLGAPVFETDALTER